MKEALAVLAITIAFCAIGWLSAAKLTDLRMQELLAGHGYNSSDRYAKFIQNSSSVVLPLPRMPYSGVLS
jgi:hypothetical protein